MSADVADAVEEAAEDPTSMVITLCLTAYVVVSLTIPYWVPIVKRLSGDCGVYWVRPALDTRQPLALGGDAHRSLVPPPS